jgi:hypothetical protein
MQAGELHLFEPPYRTCPTRAMKAPPTAWGLPATMMSDQRQLRRTGGKISWDQARLDLLKKPA